MEYLYELAEALDLTVVERRGEHLGGYRPGEKIVRLTPRQPRRATRSVFAHEIGHHALGHLPTPFGPLRARQEAAANEWAAERLIIRDSYIEVERLRDGHVPSMAFDLDVLPEIIEAYQRLIHRERHEASISGYH